MKLIEQCNSIFTQAIETYHQTDNVDHPMPTPYPAGSFEMLLFHKSWIDTVQWHYEDIIREPSIDPVEALALKRRIDSSNQDRTDKVEYIDNYFLDLFSDVTLQEGATINTETLAWAIDRYSILMLKIYHMQQETLREDVSEEHKQGCQTKLDVLLEQQCDMTISITQLYDDIAQGKKIIKTYKQMKMYNDPALNPVLYAKQS
ncbi:MAG: DUF4254 domain-containing protein [Rikenellaceae bacterium]